MPCGTTEASVRAGRPRQRGHRHGQAHLRRTRRTPPSTCLQNDTERRSVGDPAAHRTAPWRRRRRRISERSFSGPSKSTPDVIPLRRPGSSRTPSWMNMPSLSAPVHSWTTLSPSKCMMVTTHSLTGRPVGGAAHIPSSVRPPEGRPQYDRVGGHNHLFDVEEQVGDAWW